MNAAKLVPVVAMWSMLWVPGAAARTDDVKASNDSTKYSAAAAALKDDMRKLWTDHVVWTRDYIVAALADQPDAQAAANRLMKNQEDIGGAVAKFYGAQAGQQLTTLLKEHISTAVDVVKAAKGETRPRSSRPTRNGNRTRWRLRTSSARRTRSGRAPRSST